MKAVRWFSRVWESVRRAIREFLGLPVAIAASFLLLAGFTYLMDRARLPWLDPVRQILRDHVFTDARATSALLSTIASGLITVTSITISLLLLSVAQSAGSLTSEVVDQFLRRRYNQVYFGYFVGLSLFALLTLGTVSEPFNPVIGATVAFLLTVIGLVLLLVLLYTSVNQMRPVEIIETIHDHVIHARKHQLLLIARTRRTPEFTGPAMKPVVRTDRGFVTYLDLDMLLTDPALRNHECEIRLKVSIGTYVAFQDVVAEVFAANHEVAERVAELAGRAIRLERQRDVATDPAHGLEQLEAIAWTSISSSKSNPAPGLLAVRALRDTLARWSQEEPVPAVARVLPLVYHDSTFDHLLNTFESLAVVSTESMQHQTFTEVVDTFASMFERIPKAYEPRFEDVILRIITGLADHVLTAELDGALRELRETLLRASRQETAELVAEAHRAMRAARGHLHSRSTRGTPD